MMVAYRLEHKKSGLGPFHHRSSKKEGYQVEEVMYLGFHKDPETMADEKLIAYLEKRRHWVYGWSTKKKFDQFCPPSLRRKFEAKGFVIKRYKVGIAHYRLPDGQVLFQR